MEFAVGLPGLVGEEMLELRYLGEAIAWVDYASAFTPANDDLVYLNAILYAKHAA